MIYTVTFNPAIDYVVHIGDIALGMTNRSETEEMYFGGKGINVSAVLKELGVKSKALGFVAGFTGKALTEGVRNMGIDADFVTLTGGNTRINVKIKSKEETEINGQGPDIDQKAIEALFGKLNQLGAGDLLILAGSVPKTLPGDIYEKILAFLSGRDIKFVVDATGELLVNVLKYKPFLVKPNKDELGEIFGVILKTEEEIIACAKRLKEMGARNVLVSMAGDGSILVDENGQVHVCSACKGEVKNSVGAGDSMVAGFVAGIMNGNYEHALKLGTAAGGATAFSEGLAKKELVEELMKQL